MGTARFIILATKLRDNDGVQVLPCRSAPM
jgi:hypothetical protein